MQCTDPSNPSTTPKGSGVECEPFSITISNQLVHARGHPSTIAIDHGYDLCAHVGPGTEEIARMLGISTVPP